MSIESDKKLNEGLFSRVIDLVFFGGLKDVVDKAEDDITEIDPDASEKIADGMRKLRNDIDDWNQDIEQYCKENPTSPLCRAWIEQGRPKMVRNISWRKGKKNK